ncbi:preprotein translocase subunit SecY [Methylovirgula sp. 4M-Z18]|uniref:preprotein translocase subunit SecY n=1 Tax=Methylovirgula sp. 4M-Z18 TaxID=2293567 RepID=UPI000E2EF461|nr:preprotein translocase subunit SecY [Methylovirgula sp. 4M-Z18]RFB80847.1 preprotein translocase subunit SecY [Methylovirgula sp. 4M-Z18]
MASAAEQLAASINWNSFSKAEELKKRIWFTLAALVIYRLGCYIPLPGIDTAKFASSFANQSGGILGMFNLLSGGAVQRMAIFALNIMPYISSSIIIQLLTTVIPTLENLKKEGEQGRKVMNQYTRYLTVALATFQAAGIGYGLQRNGMATDPGVFFMISTVLTLVGGTMFIVWLGEQITSRGIGNGSSLIIFAGIAAQLLTAVTTALDTGATTGNYFISFVVVVMMVGVISFIVYMERAQRRLLITYPKRQEGNRVYEGRSSFLPLKLNTSGVIPPIFASSLLLLPTTISGFAGNSTGFLANVLVYMAPGRPLYVLLYTAMIVFFAFFYTAIVFNPVETADNLKKQGGFVPGIRPGERTAQFIDTILTRITVLGALYLALICIIPDFVLNYYSLPRLFGGTSLLIVVSVTMDTVAQVHGHLQAQQYAGLLKRAKLRGRKR